MIDREDIEKLMAGEKMDVFAFQHIDGGWVVFFESEDGIDDYVLIGKAQCIFETVDRDQAIQKASEMLDEKIKQTYAEAELKVNQIKDQKAKLLSLTFDPKGDSND